MTIDKEKVILAARNAAPLTIKTYTLPHDTEDQLENILDIFLKEMGRENLKDALFYCLRELAVNAKKANTKRVYFIEKGLDLGSDVQYQEGMKAFKQETLNNIDYFLQKQKEAGLYIKIVFHNQNNVFNLFIANNAEMTRKEQIRVYDRIARSRAFNTMEEALATVLDDSEGAGLGLVILVLMLKRMGLSEDAFDIDVENGETIARLSIPMSDVRKDDINAISDQVISYINELPLFPENISALQNMINNPEIDIADISRSISTDPALTAGLLKLVNSAAFMTNKKVESIHEAVMLVGMRGLRNLLYSYGTQKVLGAENEKTRVLWQHSYRCAFYSYQIAKNILRNKGILDDVYIGGILHDMGKIAFTTVHPELIKNIARFCIEKGVSQVLFEDMAAGLNHAQLGAKIATKWNFPEVLVEAIAHHHHPSTGKKQYAPVLNTVYLANCLCEYEVGELTFDQIDPLVLVEFGIRAEAQLQAVQTKLSAAFFQETRNKE